MTVAVSQALAARTQDLQPATRRVADFVLADPRAAAGLTIGELAEASGSSTASVVRLCRELGFDGYRDFRTALASELAVREQLWLDRTGDGDIGEGDDIASVVAKITTADVRAVEETARGLSIDELTAVARALLAARQVHVVGMGASGLVAMDLSYKLQRIGRPAMGHSDAHLALTGVALAEGGDVVVAISHSGTTRDTLEVMALAAEGGASTVAVTNAPMSPLAQRADHVLLTAAHETSFRAGASASRLAQLTVVDCVFVAVAQLGYDASRDALVRTADALKGRRGQSTGR